MDRVRLRTGASDEGVATGDVLADGRTRGVRPGGVERQSGREGVVDEVVGIRWSAGRDRQGVVVASRIAGDHGRVEPAGAGLQDAQVGYTVHLGVDGGGVRVAVAPLTAGRGNGGAVGVEVSAVGDVRVDVDHDVDR